MAGEPRYIDSMSTHRVATMLLEDGVINLRDLPFHQGEVVEVTVKPMPSSKPGDDRYPLRGESVIYIDPMEPVADEDWEALK